MKRRCLVGLSLILTLAAAQYAAAQGGNWNQGNAPARQQAQQQMRITMGTFSILSPAQVLRTAVRNTNLNLTQAQVDTLNQLQTSYTNELSLIPSDSKTKLSPADALEKANQELRDVLVTKNASDEEIQAKMKACLDAEEAVNAISLKYWAQIRNTLTEAQLKLVNQPMMMMRQMGAPGTTGQNRQDNPNRTNRQDRQNNRNPNNGNWGYNN